MPLKAETLYYNAGLLTYLVIFYLIEYVKPPKTEPLYNIARLSTYMIRSSNAIHYWTVQYHQKPETLIALQGSEVTYIYSCILLAAVPLVCAGAGYATVKFQNSRRRHFKTMQEENNNGRSVDKMMVKEWLHQVSSVTWQDQTMRQVEGRQHKQVKEGQHETSSVSPQPRYLLQYSRRGTGQWEDALHGNTRQFRQRT